MIRIKLLYFAGVRDAVGKPEETVELPSEVRSVVELSGHMEKTRAALSGRLDSVRFAVNETFVDGEHVLSDGDVVALIPPVAGG